MANTKMQQDQKVLNKLRELLVINNPYYTKSDNRDFLLLKKWVSELWQERELKDVERDDINDLYTILKDIRNNGCVNGVGGLIYDSQIKEDYYEADLIFYMLQQFVHYNIETDSLLRISEPAEFTPYVWAVIELDAYNVLNQIEDGD